MSTIKLDTVDDVSRATTPNALRAASDDDIDPILNIARGHLRGSDLADIRQTEASLNAVLVEKTWRRDKWSRLRAWLALGVAIVALFLSLWNSFVAANNPHRPTEGMSQSQSTTSPMKIKVDPKSHGNVQAAPNGR
jgi:hypothetical protein